MKLKMRFSALLLALCLLLTGRGTAESWWGGASKKQSEPVEETKHEPLTVYEAPPLATAAFHVEKAEGTAGMMIDLSAVDEGYVAVSANSDKRLKFQVLKDDYTYNYDLASDGKHSIFPLQCGNGHYTFRIMENVSEKKYAQAFRTECDVVMLDEFQPFLRPSDYTDYGENSECVRKAAELASSCANRLELVSTVYGFVCEHIIYDSIKAASVKSGYLPDVDETMRSGKGICFDYASLAAAMLRSQGVPTKIVFGYVAPNDLFHAWNMIYTEESGWVTISFPVKDKSWNRLDLTFAANGADDSFIGDGSNYTDVYFY